MAIASICGALLGGALAVAPPATLPAGAQNGSDPATVVFLSDPQFHRIGSQIGLDAQSREHNTDLVAGVNTLNTVLPPVSLHQERRSSTET